MKRLHIFSLLVALLASFSCTDFKEEDVSVKFGVSEEELAFSAGSSSHSVSVSSARKWDVTSMPSWVSLESISHSGASPYEWTATFSVSPNKDYFRESSIIFKTNAEIANVRVTQEGEKGKYFAVESVSVSPAELTLTEGENASLTATVSPSNATIKAVTWTSNNTSIAAVSSNGRVDAVAPGSVLITVTTEDGKKTATCSVTVKAKVVPVTGVSLNKTSLTLTEGDVQELIATVTPSNATDQSVTWSSSNTSVATVSSAGVVTAKSAGSATITVKTNDGGKTATCSVTVNPKKEVIQFADANLKRYLVSYYDTDNDAEISYDEAAAVTSIVTLNSVKSVTSFNEFQYFTGVQAVPDAWLKGCQNLKSVVLPASVSTIGTSAFENCTSLSSINLSSSVQVQASAFKGTALSGNINVASFVGDAFNGTAVTQIREHSTNMSDFYDFQDCLISVPASCKIGLKSSIYSELNAIVDQLSSGIRISIDEWSASMSSKIVGLMVSIKQLEAAIDSSPVDQVRESLNNLWDSYYAITKWNETQVYEISAQIDYCSNYFFVANDFKPTLEEKEYEIESALQEISIRIRMCEARLSIIIASLAPNSAPKQIETRASSSSYSLDGIVSLFREKVFAFD